MTGPLAPTQLEGALSAAGHTFGCVHCHVLGHGTAMATPSLPAATTLQLSGFNSRLIHTQPEPTQGRLPKVCLLQCSGTLPASPLTFSHALSHLPLCHTPSPDYLLPCPPAPPFPPDLPQVRQHLSSCSLES